MPTAIKEFEGTLDEILEHREELTGHRLRLIILDDLPIGNGALDLDLSRRWTPQELMKLPKERRDKIMEYQFDKAAEYYQTDPEVQEWERAGAQDFYDYGAAEED